VAFDLSGDDVVFAWLAGEPDAELRDAILNWLPLLSNDPEGVADAPVPGFRVPAFVAFPDVGGVVVAVTYVVLGPPLHAVRIVEMRTLGA
jgi:hypothetical protein